MSVGRIHENGKEFIMKILTQEDLILEYQIFKRAPKYYHFAKPITDCELLVIDRAEFEDCALRDKALLASLTSYLSTGYLKANIKCQDLIMNGKKVDCIAFLSGYAILSERELVMVFSLIFPLHIKN